MDRISHTLRVFDRSVELKRQDTFYIDDDDIFEALTDYLQLITIYSRDIVGIITSYVSCGKMRRLNDEYFKFILAARIYRTPVFFNKQRCHVVMPLINIESVYYSYIMYDPRYVLFTGEYDGKVNSTITFTKLVYHPLRRSEFPVQGNIAASLKMMKLEEEFDVLRSYDHY
jgi:hypothetical protein